MIFVHRTLNNSKSNKSIPTAVDGKKTNRKPNKEVRSRIDCKWVGGPPKPPKHPGKEKHQEDVGTEGRF